ncbi:MAG: glycosyltransferase family 39 protein [Candidatus Omnitrophota bacterium]|nr:glycosyltransferase family 39 protein [Candidatus Omnitrophota bacterium]
MWVTALLFKLLGISVFSAVLFSSLSAVALVAVIYYLGKLLANQWVGFFAGAAYLITNHVIRLARLARMDIPVSLFITAAILCFILAQRRSRAYYLLFGLFTCLAIFTKDVSGLAPLVIVSMYLVLRGQWKELIHPWFLAGLAVAFLPLAAWVMLDQNTLFNTWFRCNFMHLYKSPAFKNPWYYYITTISRKYFYLLPFALYGGYLAFRRAFKDKQYEFYLLIIWVLIFPVAFSFGRQKLHYFIMPIYPAAALLVGLTIEKLTSVAIKPKIAVVLKYLLVIYATVMLCLPINIRSHRDEELVVMAPAIEETLKYNPGCEFIAYNYDSAAALWYVRSLIKIPTVKDLPALEDQLGAAANSPRLCFISADDFARLNPAVRRNCRILLKYKKRLLVVSPKSSELSVVLSGG